MGRIGPAELIIILVLVLIIFGPSRLPELARSLGKSIREFRKAGQSMVDDSDESEEGEAPRGDQATH